MRISVLGAGGWGTTLSIILNLNAHDVTLWEYKRNYARTLRKTRINKLYLPGIKIPDEINITNSLSEACHNKHMIIIAIPTQFIRSIVREIKKEIFLL